MIKDKTKTWIDSYNEKLMVEKVKSLNNEELKEWEGGKRRRNQK